MERLFEEVFVEVCAPTLRGIKPSNLFRYQPQNRDKLLEALDFWNRELEPSGLQVRALKECSRTGAFLILVYREEWLRFILGKKVWLPDAEDGRWLFEAAFQPALSGT